MIEYYRVFEKFAADPSLTDFTETQLVTTGEMSNLILDELQVLRENGHLTEGERSFHDLRVGEPRTVGDVTTAEVVYCNDRSAVRVLDAVSRADTGHRPYPFINASATLEKGLDDVWRMSMLRTDVVESC
ncbi:hypothetical protein LKO27_01220 [Tessaracoccus sp. OS52]|uniref:hypothetical protein n=1 Tax=Tessaracoccus sp. OS52 TaxID=2886691 RepID=UPI001D114886|nr:hypothetical protein [Tessaracoccus sp. OS52]MCC2592051.1 hypothetical protein [Tessaracoccus sp. OS52]